MNDRNPDLHGNAPDKADGALLIIDMINDFDFPDAEELHRHAVPAARRIAALADRAREAGVPVVYVNDNFGRWRSDFRSLVEHCLACDCRGREIAELLKPRESDYFVLKPKHSGFYMTTLATLLEYLGAKTLIFAGITADICVLFTANDAYMRDYALIVAADCVASVDEGENRHALDQMRRILKAEVIDSEDVDLEPLGAAARQAASR